MNQKIKDLQAQINAEQEKMNRCEHKFGNAFYNPEIKREPYGYSLDGHGSDIWYVPAGYHDVSHPRWTRVCKNCGKEEHTYSQKPIVSGFEPDFGN